MITLEALDKTKGDRERVVILGSGWAGYMLSRKLSAKKFQTLIISPRSYFVFTPLLNSTAVGTLEFRTVLEPIRSKRYPHVEFMQAWADDVDFADKTVSCEESVVYPGVEIGSRGSHPEAEAAQTKRGKMWEVNYDKLVIAVGCYNQTFGTKGVKEHAFFMKDVADPRKVRKRVLECFEVASLPTTTEEVRRQLLNFAIIGGGPTGMEIGAELSDLVNEDLLELYPDLKGKVNISVYDVADRVLNMFESRLGDYAMKTFARESIQIKTQHNVESLRPGLRGIATNNSAGCYTLTTKEDGEMGVGMCVWSTGNMMNPFVQTALAKRHPFPSTSASVIDGGKQIERPEDKEWVVQRNPKSGAILVDEHLRLQLHTPTPDSKSDPHTPIDTDAPAPSPLARATLHSVFALGDNAALASASLPATAQTANQQALWLGARLNDGDVASKTFDFKNMGIMTYLGAGKGLVQSGSGREIEGRTAWVVWRGAYLWMSVSWRNKVLMAVYWAVNWVVGRDVSRF